MKRTYNWLPPVFVAVALLGYFVMRPWYRDRQVSASVDALMADLEEHGGRVEQEAGALPEVPDRPTKADLERRLTQLAARLGEARDRSQELTRRAEEVIPKAREEKRQQLRQALERYAARLRRALEKYKERGDQLRGKVKGLKAGGSKPG